METPHSIEKFASAGGWLLGILPSLLHAAQTRAKRLLQAKTLQVCLADTMAQLLWTSLENTFHCPFLLLGCGGLLAVELAGGEPLPGKSVAPRKNSIVWCKHLWHPAAPPGLACSLGPCRLFHFSAYLAAVPKAYMY